MDAQIETTSLNQDETIISFLPSFTTIIIANLVANVFNLLIGMYLVRQFTPDTYGQVTFLLARFGFFRLLATFGMGSLVTIQIAKGLHQQDQKELNQSYFSYLFIRLFVTILLAISTALLSIVLEDQNYFILSILVLPASLSDFHLAILQGDTKHKPVAIALLVQPVSYAIISFALTQYRPAIVSIYTSLIISYILSMLFGILMANRLGIRWPMKGMIKSQITKSFSRTLSISFTIVILQYAFSISSIFILGSSGLYKQSAQLGVLLSLITLPVGLIQVPIASVFQPRFVKVNLGRSPSESGKFLSNFSIFIFRITIIGTLLCFAYPTTIIYILYGNQYISSSPSLTALSPLMVILCLQYILITSMLALQRPQLAILPLVIQLALNIIFIYWISYSLEGNIQAISIIQAISAAICLGILFVLIKPLLTVCWDLRAFVNSILIASAIVFLPKYIMVLWIPEKHLWNLIALSISSVIYFLILGKNIWGTSITPAVAIKGQKPS